jgi:hypothetical protein
MQRSGDSSYALNQAANAQSLSAVTLRKVTWRLIPFLFVLYVIAWLDRVNVGVGCRSCRMRPATPACISGYRTRACAIGPLWELWAVLVDADSVPDRASGGCRDSIGYHDRECGWIRRTSAHWSVEDPDWHPYGCVPSAGRSGRSRYVPCSANWRTSNTQERTTGYGQLKR